MSKKILFFGNERLATGVKTSNPVLEALLANDYEIAAIVVAQNEPARSRQSRQLEVAVVAEKHKIPLLAINNLDDVKTRAQLAVFGAEAAVLVAYGKLVPTSLIEIFPGGIINLHPSLLPLHRGSTPIESAILDGDNQTGVALMQLAEEMDAGPVFIQASRQLSGQESKQELADQLTKLGADLIIKHLPAILDGRLVPKQQDESKATYDSHISKSDGNLDWTKPAERLEREVRAFADWPRSRTSLSGKEIIVTKAHVAAGNGQPGTINVKNNQLSIYCGNGCLVIDSLIPPGKTEMPTSAWLIGLKNQELKLT
ncbi:MAG TPA: methionyl-tRNA formyltransferase [Candidatus Saccharimonadales bacterium]|nr:methionyl-tRNA formyltransferase [Candidatus Saccharimonadales bacterium]